MAEGAGVVIIGTYESALVGYRIVSETDKTVSVTLKFTNQCHIGHVLSVDNHSAFVASGGDDEIVRLLDIRRGVELGSLTHHEGSLNKLVFHQSAGKLFLLCASNDGTISIWKCPQWDCSHSLTGHKGAVSAVDVHPSGRFLLSVGVDRTLMTWNLMTGRQAFVMKLPKASSDVKFSPDGSKFYLIISGGSVDIYDTATVAVKCSIGLDTPVLACLWWSDNQIIVGDQEGSLHLFSVEDAAELQVQLKSAHKNRVKCLGKIPVGDRKLLASTSSDGVLALWTVKRKKLEQITSVNVPGRPICMTVCT